MKARGIIVMAAFVTTVSGCAFAGHRSSPWEWGGGLRVAPAVVELSETTTLHPLLGYTYLRFDGGHDALIEVGGQVRYHLGSGPWLGGEAGFAQIRTSIDDFDGTFSANGLTLGVLGGKPVGNSRWGINPYAGFGVTRFEGGNGINVRLGVDLQPWFLKRQSASYQP